MALVSFARSCQHSTAKTDSPLPKTTPIYERCSGKRGTSTPCTNINQHDWWSSDLCQAKYLQVVTRSRFGVFRWLPRSCLASTRTQRYMKFTDFQACISRFLINNACILVTVALEAISDLLNGTKQEAEVVYSWYVNLIPLSHSLLGKAVARATQVALPIYFSLSLTLTMR